MEKYGIEIPGGWFDEERHLYRNQHGTIVPSATQVFEINGLYNFDPVPEQTMRWKSGYGTAIHSAVSYLVVGDLDWDTVDKEIVVSVTAIETRLKEMQFELVATEEPRIASIYGMEYGMTSDLRGTIMYRGQRRSAIIDLKSGSKWVKYWDWQIGAYVWPQEKVPLGWVGVVLQVDAAGGITPHHVKDVEAAKREFQILLASAILKINNGFAKIGKAA
jgi:hypothetical protein